MKITAISESPYRLEGLIGEGGMAHVYRGTHRQTGVMAGSLHNAYLLATGFAVMTLLIAFQLPARLSPTQS